MIFQNNRVDVMGTLTIQPGLGEPIRAGDEEPELEMFVVAVHGGFYL